MNKNEKDGAGQIMQYITSAWTAQMISAVTELGIPDLLAKGGMPVEMIAEKCGSNEEYLYRVLRTLSVTGVFREEAGRCFSHTPASVVLQSDKMGPIVRMFLSDWHQAAWGKLFQSVKSGKPAFEEAFGIPCFEWFGANHEAAELFNRANSSKAAASQSSVISAYNFTGIKTAADIGGGSGGLMLALLSVYPEIEGLIADLPHTLEAATAAVEGLSMRCRVDACDFFTEVPFGFDCYFLSNILHDWNDDKCRLILRNCCAAMKDDSRLMIIESVLPDDGSPSIAALLDIEVMVMGGGRERTESEYLCLFENNGLCLEKRIDTSDNVSLLVCRRGTE